MLLTTLLLPIEKLINHALQLDGEMFARLQKLTGKALAIHLQGPELTIYLLICGRGIQFCQTLERPVDTTIHGTPLTLARLALMKDPLVHLRTGEVKIDGDMEFIQQLQHIIASLRIDWEEQLSHYVGDMAASQLGAWVKNTQAWHTELSHTLCQNFGEYLQEEARYFPPREEVTDCMAAIDDLRLSADRLYARLRRLESLIKD